MKITFKSRNYGTEVFESDYESHKAKTDSPIFKFIESEFDDWMDWVTIHRKEYWEMYFSDEAIYSKKSAIRAAISQALEWAEEANARTLNEKKIKTNIDLDAIFQAD